MPHLSIQPHFLGKLFSNIKTLQLEENHLKIEYKNGQNKTLAYADLEYPEYQNSLFNAKLSLTTQKTRFDLTWLPTKNLDKIRSHLSQAITQHLEHKIEQSFHLVQHLIINHYLKESQLTILSQYIDPVCRKYLSQVELSKQYLNQDILDKLQQVLEFYPIHEKAAHARAYFEQKALKEKKEFFDKVESNPLTEQQRLAVIRNDDYNLVLAAAGTGKTSVMVAKALDLIQSQLAGPEEILILAYNSKAAKEVSERLDQRLIDTGIKLAQVPKILTFHALGSSILKKCERSTTISTLAKDEHQLKFWVSEWIKAYLLTAPQNLFTFIELSYEPVDVFSFKTKAEYDAYVRDNEYRTLQGERVRGYQELLIANWLFMHNVPYAYEPKYVTKRRIELGFDYTPDFYLTDAKIYLEHFGIDRRGRTRADIDHVRYNQDIRNKRQLHTEMGTRLIETYHYDWLENNLEARLAELLTQHQVPFAKKSEQEIIQALERADVLTKNVRRYVKCLQAIRTERLDEQGILQRLTQHQIPYAENYAALLHQLHQDYIQTLQHQGRIDFDSMIVDATDLVHSRDFIPTWKYILVDEFQDISTARMELIKALIEQGPTPTPSLTVVGDDWQSIYRFSGGKLELTTRFEETVGPHALSKLEKTYRYNNSIADIAGKFVMQNPEQYVKNVSTHTQITQPAIHLMEATHDKNQSLQKKVLDLVQRIRTKEQHASIAIMARYNTPLTESKNYLRQNGIDMTQLDFWTFHSSKGLEADHCILIGFSQGRLGFPSQSKEEGIIEALLPALDNYPNSEERRLFYVALTRAKKQVFLLADPLAPSDFITELLGLEYGIHIESDTFQNQYRKQLKCPLCTHGYLRKHSSAQHKLYYKCTSGTVCVSNPRVCKVCEAPAIDMFEKGKPISRCNNPQCNKTMKLCPKCGRGLRFLGDQKTWMCSGYADLEDPCDAKVT